jgi:hypothetical protein
VRQVRLAEHYFFRTAFRRNDLPSALDDLAKSTKNLVRVKVVLGDFELDKQFQGLSARGSFNVETWLEDRGVLAGILSTRIGRREPRQESGRFYIQRHSASVGAWLLITCESGDFETSVLRRAIKALRPRPTKPLLRTRQIQDILMAIAAVPGVSGPPRATERVDFAPHPRILQVGSRTRIESVFAGKAIEADRRWTDVSIGEAFREAREAERWVTDATMAYWFHGRHAHMKLTRRGQLVFDSTPLQVFWKAVDEVARLGLERIRFLRGRDRARETGFVSRPFAIEFAEPVFSSRERIASFHEAISGITHSNCTVLHGNPYFHAALVDYTDGSTYEVAILDASRITIIPQGRASARALQRFCVRVFSQVREGEFREVEL